MNSECTPEYNVIQEFYFDYFMCDNLHFKVNIIVPKTLSFSCCTDYMRDRKYDCTLGQIIKLPVLALHC